MANLKNINFMSEERFNSLTETSEDELYAVETDWLLDNKITNCLIHIPQDIKLELVDGTLTLKAGSKVYVPNGFETDGTTPKFDVVTVESDYSLLATWGTAEKMAIFLKPTEGLAWAGSTRLVSGTTAPTATITMYWYDTNENLIKYYAGGSFIDSGYSLPIALCTKTSSIDDSKVASIDQVFNGFGYIGSTVFVLPGFECLISRGKLANGIDNYKFVNNKVFTGGLHTADSLNRIIIAFVKNNELTLNLGTTGLGGANHILLKNFIESPVNPKIADNALWFNTNNYKFYFNSKDNVDSPVECLPVIFALNSAGDKSKTLSFCDFKTTFQAVDYNDKSTIIGWGMPDYSARVSLTASTSNQTVPSRGWLCWQQAYTGNTQYYFYVNDMAIGYGRYNTSGTGGSSIFVPVDYGDVFKVTSTSSASITFYPMKGD